MSDFANYIAAQGESRRWRAETNYASSQRELACIRERMAELRSQHEPLNSLTDGNSEERKRILDAVFYVVVGRFPKSE